MQSKGLDDFASKPPAYSASETTSAGSSLAFRTTFASISLHMDDKIRFVQFPAEDLQTIRATIKRYWANGVQRERQYGVSYEFKLLGRPWSGSGTGPDAVPALVLVRELLASLYSIGWIMTASTDISRKKYDKDTMIFRKQPVPPPTALWNAISFKKHDELRILGAPSELTLEFSSLLKSLKILQSEEKKVKRNMEYYEFKLRGTPWSSEGEETMRIRLVMLKMIELLETHGWSLYASIDQNSGPSGDSNYSETDCWYCVKSADWVPGSIILHR